MRTTEHTANPASTPQAGRFATLRGLHHTKGSGAPSRTLLALPVLLTALAATLACSGAFAAPALALPEGRHYERVSPAYKGGYGASGIAMVSEDGEEVAFESALGVFAGAQWDTTSNVYLADRTGEGWLTSSLQPPPTGAVTDFSSGMEYVEANERPEATREGQETVGSEYLLHDVADPAANVPSSWSVFAGTVLRPLDGEPFDGLTMDESGDLCHILLTSSALVPEAEGQLEQLYDFSRGCGGGEPGLRLVGVNNSGRVLNPECAPAVGLGNSYDAESREQSSSFNDVSSNGGVIFFTDGLGDSASCTGQPHPSLFARLGGERTVEISRPVEACGAGEVDEVPCPGATVRESAYFKGASEDGSRVFFTTRASPSLATGEASSGNDLYVASLGCGEGEAGCAVADWHVLSLAQASPDLNPGEPAEVLGVVRIAPDGSRVYYVARGVLSDGPNEQGREPVSGADNLYVFDADTKTVGFVAELCSGPAESGGATDLSCPANLTVGSAGSGQVGVRNDSYLWSASSSGDQEAQSTRDARFLLFGSYGRLVRGDTGTARQVYRYDAETGVLDRVSLGEQGHDANGNGVEPSLGAYDASIAPAGINPGPFADAKRELGVRAISDDGSRIVFSSAEPLSPQAINGRVNVYEWHEQPGSSDGGAVSIVSSGTSLTNDLDAVISPSGQNIFFVTAAGLVPGDTDGLQDVYDARLGGGFPPLPAGEEECSGDACQGPLTNPAPLLVPGSVAQAPGENLPASTPAAAVVKPKAKPTKCKRGFTKNKHDKCVKEKKKSKKAKKASKSTRGGKS